MLRYTINNTEFDAVDKRLLRIKTNNWRGKKPYAKKTIKRE